MTIKELSLGIFMTVYIAGIVLVLWIIIGNALRHRKRIDALRKQMFWFEEVTGTTYARHLKKHYEFTDLDIERTNQVIDHDLYDLEMLKRLEKIYL